MHPQACICGKTDELQLHHLTYERLGDEDLSDLTPLCADCHAMVHVLERRGLIGLDFSGFVNERRAERNREVMRQRRDMALDDMQSERDRKRARSLSGRLRDVMNTAQKRHVDISSDLRVIEKRMRDIERKLLPDQ